MITPYRSFFYITRACHFVLSEATMTMCLQRQRRRGLTYKLPSHPITTRYLNIPAQCMHAMYHYKEK